MSDKRHAQIPPLDQLQKMTDIELLEWKIIATDSLLRITAELGNFHACGIPPERARSEAAEWERKAKYAHTAIQRSLANIGNILRLRNAERSAAQQAEGLGPARGMYYELERAARALVAAEDDGNADDASEAIDRAWFELERCLAALDTHHDRQHHA